MAALLAQLEETRNTMERQRILRAIYRLQKEQEVE